MVLLLETTGSPASRTRPLSKAADAPYVADMAPQQAMLNEQLKANTLRQIARLGLGAAGIGAGAAGLLGLHQLLFKPHVPKTKQLDDSDVELNIPTKRADWADDTVKAVMPTDSAAGRPSMFSPAWLRGDTQTSGASMPWAIPAAAAAGFGGLAGGHSLVQWLLNKKRKGDISAEVASAKKEYDDALQGMYGKKASALDTIYTKLEKQGLFNDLAGLGTGSYALLAGLMGASSGALSYKYFKSREKAKALEEAVKTRQRMNAMSSPPELYLRLANNQATE